MLRAILILPGTALVVIPGSILWLTHGTAYGWALASPRGLRFWGALALAAAGLYLMARTIAMFARIGKGSLAPWDPTTRLVAAGVYRHVRNPMISGVCAVILGEALMSGSLMVLAWAAFFAVVNAIYMPLSEEPGLEKRFGDDYRRYKANVPRWIPRLRPWEDADKDI
jgi:protein-S-isoprenylcysteine O-methyltransferase Ste14